MWCVFDTHLFLFIFTVTMFVISWWWVGYPALRVQLAVRAVKYSRTQHSSCFKLASITAHSAALYIFFLAILLLAACYWYSWAFDYTITQFSATSRHWFYLVNITVLSLLVWRVYHVWVQFNRLNSEALNTTILLFLAFFLYLHMNNLLILTFVLECQGIILIYFIAQNQNNFKFTKLFKSVLSSFNQLKIWRSNALFVQFWANFFGAVILFLCTIQLIGIFGVTSWQDLNWFVLLDNLLLLIKHNKLAFLLLILILGFMLKIGLAPFHFWKPELYRNLTFVNMFVYATIYVFAVLFLFIYIIKCNYCFLSPRALKIIWIVVLISLYLIVGLLFFVSEIKIFLAYTSLAHLTYMFTLLTVPHLHLDKMLFYLFVYIFLTLATFGVLLAFKNFTLNFLSDLQLLTQFPYLMFQFIVVLAAMAGLPPLLGFWGKLLIVLSLWDNADYLLALSVLGCGLILLYFYFQNYRFSFTINTNVNYRAVQLIPASFVTQLGILLLLINLNGHLFINDFFVWATLNLC